MQRIRLPMLGERDLSAWPLLLLTVTLAAIDGFNPCAMWVLVFLIGLLLGIHDSARRWLLGSTFLVVTALVYYVVIAAWLNVVLAFGLMTPVRVAVGLVALGGGAYYGYGYWRGGPALCRVTDAKQRQRLMARLRAAVTEPRFAMAAFAIALLAVGVNFVELMCSAGLPVVYTQLLAQTRRPELSLNAHFASATWMPYSFKTSVRSQVRISSASYSTVRRRDSCAYSAWVMSRREHR